MDASQGLDIIVVGSCNMDLMAYVSRLPKPGETLEGHRYETGFGGKGANQCVAGAKLGANMSMVAKVGADDLGAQYIRNLNSFGINTKFVYETTESSTGVAPITVGDDGSNSIVIISGANLKLTPHDVQESLSSLKSAKVVVCQLEVRRDTTLEALKIAKQKGMTTIFNPAPAPQGQPLESDFFGLSDVICPNETEATIMTGIDVTDVNSGKLAANKLYERGCAVAIVTMGEMGCVFMYEGLDEAEHVRPEPITQVVDTTGAGDAFAGALAFFYAKYPHLSVKEKIMRACEVASASVQKPGTQKSYPARKELPEKLFE